MENNNICTAPEIVDVDALFETWHNTRPGNRADFFRFMTTPSTERDKFIAEQGIEFRSEGAAIVVIVKN